jgi:lipopolysaccharide transport system ATP-binding protein
MSETAIIVENLGKRYRIGARQERHDSFAEAFTSALLSPFRRLRNLRQPVPRDETLWALRNVSFQVEPGEVLGIIGRNGAGKSTLLKLLSRITEPTEGRIKMRGRLGSLLEVGTGFHPELTGRENVYLNGTILGMRRDEIDRKFDQIISFSGIEKFLDTPVKRYSSGMYVRLAFAVAAHLEPEILVVDEVLAVGDAEFQRKCLGKMGEVAREGRTILFVSHSMPAIKSLCTRAILLDHGQLLMDDEVEKVVTTYLKSEDAVKGDGSIPENAARINNGQGWLRRVGLYDGAAQAISQIFLGQDFCVSLIYDIKDLIEEAAVEVGISTLDGLRVATVCSLDDCGAPLKLAPGVHELRVAIEVTMLPGEYTLDVFLHNLSTNTTVDWVDRTFQFTALNLSEVGEDHYHWGRVRGFVRPKSSWQAPIVCNSSK